MRENDEELDYITIAEGFAELRLSRNKGYQEINAGRLQTFVIGTRRFIARKALADYKRARIQEGQEYQPIRTVRRKGEPAASKEREFSAP